MSAEVKSFLQNHGVATSRTTPYNPRCNGQCERYNGIIWKSVMLALESRGMKESQWESVLPDALHSIRSLLCTSTNCTPHERFFGFARRTTSGQSVPTWLTQPGPVYMKRHVRASKYEPLVEEVQLLEANPTYAHVRLPDGRETTVSVRHLAPTGQSENTTDEPIQEANHTDTDISNVGQLTPAEFGDQTLESPDLRRSKRIIKKPSRYGFDD